MTSCLHPPSPVVTRFAPSPTGNLHLGHVYAALIAWQEANKPDGRPPGRYLVRIEDIDIARSRPAWEKALLSDLAWLGLTSQGPVLRQSRRLDHYRAAVDHLKRAGVVYPCFCSRREIAAELTAMASAPHGPDGALYPGTCRHRPEDERKCLIAEGRPFALRLDVARARERIGSLSWAEEGSGHDETVAVDAGRLGDVVVARKDAPASYHIAVVVDDAAQGVTLVTRGRDLIESTHIHRVLQALLDLPAPRYHHHRLLADEHGHRLAKRAQSLSVAALRDQGLQPAEVIALARAGPFVVD